jgi:hypothetical protein
MYRQTLILPSPELFLGDAKYGKRDNCFNDGVSDLSIGEAIKYSKIKKAPF